MQCTVTTNYYHTATEKTEWGMKDFHTLLLLKLLKGDNYSSYPITQQPPSQAFSPNNKSVLPQNVSIPNIPEVEIH